MTSNWQKVLVNQLSCASAKHCRSRTVLPFGCNKRRGHCMLSGNLSQQTWIKISSGLTHPLDQCVRSDAQSSHRMPCKKRGARCLRTQPPFEGGCPAKLVKIVFCGRVSVGANQGPGIGHPFSLQLWSLGCCSGSGQGEPLPPFVSEKELNNGYIKSGWLDQGQDSHILIQASRKRKWSLTLAYIDETVQLPGGHRTAARHGGCIVVSAFSLLWLDFVRISSTFVTAIGCQMVRLTNIWEIFFLSKGVDKSVGVVSWMMVRKSQGLQCSHTWCGFCICCVHWWACIIRRRVRMSCLARGPTH